MRRRTPPFELRQPRRQPEVRPIPCTRENPPSPLPPAGRLQAAGGPWVHGNASGPEVRPIVTTFVPWQTVDLGDYPACRLPLYQPAGLLRRSRYLGVTQPVVKPKSIVGQQRQASRQHDGLVSVLDGGRSQLAIAALLCSRLWLLAALWAGLWVATNPRRSALRSGANVGTEHRPPRCDQQSPLEHFTSCCCRYPLRYRRWEFRKSGARSTGASP